MEWALSALNCKHVPIYGWTDSTVTLAWLSQHPSKWNVYVANRVSEVQTRLPTMRWNHVPSRDNPADCASRGILASELINHALWWSGPLWLRHPSTSWPIQQASTPLTTELRNDILLETKRAAVSHVCSPSEWDLPYRYSSWTQLLRITAYIARFVQNLKRRLTKQSISTSPLTAIELRDASRFWFRTVQHSQFSAESKALRTKSPVKASSALRSLHPFLGKDELIRLGGRLENAALSYNERHPIILPRHRISALLIDYAHKITLHGGVQLTLRTLRQNYWVLSARSVVKSHIHRCIVCVRHSANTSVQLMGNLPPPRVNSSPPFSHTGVDYAGPMHILPCVGRGQKPRKFFVAVFICLSTKAIHLELVEDYSTAGFLAAFKRFVSRRGLPSNLYSDNGTNFQGADKELQLSFQSLSRDPKLLDFLAKDNVVWHFIPSAAPHFGGLWEAGVKSFKHHLKRVLGSHTLSQVEFATLLCQIEACLNSRPIAALTDDPHDLTALTPGHFLIGRPLLSVPEETALDIPTNRLSRWQTVCAMREQIWRSWSNDYLHTLQQRHKWSKSYPDLKVNDLVLLKNNLLPPSKWELARVLTVHPGNDGHVRVVTIRTARTTLKRPISQICRLPIDTDYKTI